MYKKLSISNFRSFGVNQGGKPQVVEFSPLTIIVGDNSAGKSNIIRALMMATDPYCNYLKREDFFLRKTSNSVRKSPKIELICDIELEGTNTKLETKVSGAKKETFQKEFYIDGNKIGESNAISPPSEDLIAQLKPFSLFVAPTIRDISYLSKAKDLLPIATRSTITGASTALRKELGQRLSAVTSKLSIATRFKGISARPTFNLDELMSIVGLTFEVNDEIDLPLEHLGHGDISKVIIKLAELQGGEHCIAIEEPEIHVHPTGIKTLVYAFEDLVEKNDRQVIITTHSESLVNNTKFESLVHVKQLGQRSIAKRVSALGVRSGSTEEHSIIRKSQRGLLFLSKMLVIVEGPDDRMLLEILDDRGDLDLFKNDISILELSGFGEFEKYRKVLSRIEVPYIVLMDEIQVAKCDQQGTWSNGDVFSRLEISDELPSNKLSKFDPEKYGKSAPSRKRSIVANLSNEWGLDNIGFISHGHKDINELVLEVFDGLKAAEKEEIANKLFLSIASFDIEDAIDKCRANISSKGEKLISVTQAIPKGKFGRLKKYFDSETKRLNGFN